MDTPLLSLDAILGADDRKYAIVDIPEWGGQVRIRSLNAGEAIDFADANKNPATEKTATLRLIAMSVCDGDGNLVIGLRNLDRIKAKNTEALARIAQAALDLNGFTKKAKDDAKNGSGEAPSDASPTDSQ